MKKLLLISMYGIASAIGSALLTGCSEERAEAIAPETAPVVASVARVTATQPTKASNFGLLDADGKYHELARYGRDSKAIVLYSTGVECPIARLTAPTLMALRDKYAPQGAIFLMLNANAHDERKEVAAEAKEFKNDIPILMDDTQIIASMLGISRTCEALVIDPKSFEVVYRGAIDDRVDYEAQKNEAQHKYLDDALAAFLSGQPVKVARSEVKGCVIDVEALPKEVSYTKDIVPILNQHCVMCHKPGNIGPFAFTGHEKIAGRKGMIREVLLSKRMPPWHADAPSTQFANDISLSREKMRKMIAWLEAGAPKDGESDPLAQLASAPAEEWPLGKPDAVFEIPEQKLPATGTIPYVAIEVPSGLTEPHWIRAAVVKPSNLQVTHHALVFLKYPPELKDQEPDFGGGINGYFAGYVPGQLSAPFPKDTAKWMPAGVSFHFQLHYTTTGKEETDRTQLALYFQDEKSERILETRAGSTGEFEIPPNVYDHPVTADFRFHRDSLLYGISPHMHYRGSHMKYEAEYPDGTKEILLSVPNYQFNWQTMYTFAEPKSIPGGTLVKISGSFDNSVRNEDNPDPMAAVKFGEQTWDEMFVCYMNYSENPGAPVVRGKRERGKQEEGIRTGVQLDKDNIIGTQWKGDKYTFEFAANGEMTINGTIKGTYKIEGQELHFKAAGNDFTFYLRGDVLCPDKDSDFHFRRTK
jgi:hypothetical protein